MFPGKELFGDPSRLLRVVLVGNVVALENRASALQADAYIAYDAFFTKPERGMVEVGCWAHARRHFHNALEADPPRMRTVLLMIAQLYGIERTGRERNLHGD